MTEIRTFAESDCTELRELFGRAGEDAPPLWGDEESEAAIYLNPYMDLEPDSLFVAVADGALVGYLTGCLDSFKFPGEQAHRASHQEIPPVLPAQDGALRSRAEPSRRRHR